MLRPALALTALSLLLSAPAHADQVEFFGSSVRNVGLAGAGALLPDGGATVSYNAAALGYTRPTTLRFGWQSGHIDLGEVQGVQRVDGAALGFRSTPAEPHAAMVDLSHRFGRWVGLGVNVVYPTPVLYSHETKDPWSPYAARWNNRFVRAVMHAGVSFRLPLRGLPGVGGVSAESATQGGVFLGVGVAMLPRGIIDIDLDLIGREAEGDAEQGSIEVYMGHGDLIAKLRFRPQVSLAADFGTFHEAVSGLRFGVAWRGEMVFDVSPIHLNVRVLELGNVHAIFSLVDEIAARVWLSMTDFYEPHQLKFSLALDRPRVAIAVDGQWSGWSGLVASYSRVVEGEDGEPGQLDIHLGQQELSYDVAGSRSVADGLARDTFDLRVGAELRPPPVVTAQGHELRLRLRFGYRFDQGFIDPDYSGPAALVDGDVHGGAFGVGFTGPGPRVLGPLTLDWNIAASRIVGMDLDRTPPADGSGPVRYDRDARWTGGWTLVTGVSLQAGF